MAENYDLIFGQSASQQYAWSDSDYQNGWQTVGSTPPTAEQFDALQRKSDTKAKDLNDRLSPLEEKAEADGRQAATSYTAGAMVTVDGLPNGWLLQCIVPGISGTDAITLPDTLIDGLTIIDGDVTWALRKVATNGGLGYRQPSTAYTAGQIAYHSALPTGYYLECTTAGTTSAGEITPSSTIGDTVTDGTVTWTIRASQQTIKDFSYKGNNTVNFLSDCNDADEQGIFAINGDSLNIPQTDFYGMLINLKNRALLNTCQIAGQSAGTSTSEYTLWTRYKNSSGWKNWKQIDAIVAKSLGSNGYIKYASGLILQWGQADISELNTQTTVSFPINFNNVFEVTTGAYNCNVSMVGVYKQNFYVVATSKYLSGGAMYVRYIAVGN